MGGRATEEAVKAWCEARFGAGREALRVNGRLVAPGVRRVEGDGGGAGREKVLDRVRGEGYIYSLSKVASEYSERVARGVRQGCPREAEPATAS